MKVNNQKGITIVVLTITITILIILAGITIYIGKESVKKANLEGLKTNMLLIETKAREFVENASFDLGINPQNATDEMKTNAQNELNGESKGTLVNSDDSIINQLLNMGISQEDINNKNVYKLTTENAYEYLIVIAVNGLKRLISNNYEFTYSDVSEKRKIELFTHADTIKEFCDEYITDEYVKNLTVGEVRANYKKFCKENGCRPASDRNFEAHLNSIGFVNRPRKDKNGKGVRKYVRK